MTGPALLAALAARLARAGVRRPRGEAAVLASRALGRRVGAWELDEVPLSAAQAARIDAMGRERAAGRPLAQVVGEQEFWSLPFRVTPDTLIPRADSEVLVEAALSLAAAQPRGGGRLLDVGTGSGCLLLAALSELPAAWTGVGVDASAAAVAVARGNAAALGLAGRAEMVHGDGLAPGPPPWAADVDVVLCNPPYIEEAEFAGLEPSVRDFEPRSALVGGLAVYKRIADVGHAWRAPLVLEVGHTQRRPVAALMGALGWELEEVREDMGGVERCLVLRPV